MTRFIIQDDVIDDKLGSFIAFDFTVLSKEEVMMDVCEYLNRLWNQTQRFEKENKELKEEVQLLKEGMEAYENAIPYVCTCGQVSDIHSEMFDFRMKQNKFYKEHPNRCIVVIDGVRYE